MSRPCNDFLWDDVSCSANVGRKVFFDIRFDHDAVNRKNRIDFTIASTDQMTTCVFNYLETGNLSIPVPRPAYGGMVIGR
jgi:hypothetical protein